MLKTYLDELKETWDLTHEELSDIADKMVCYALDACHDSKVREEAAALAERIDN